MVYLELLKLKKEFELETWVLFYDAFTQYFWKYDEKYYVYDDESAQRLDEEWLKKTVEILKKLCLTDKKTRDYLEHKHIKEFLRISDLKCRHPEWARYSAIYTAMKPFINETEIRDNLCSHPLIARNPLSIIQHPDEDCVLIFKPSKRLLQEYPFIKKKYSWTSRIVLYYYISMSEYKDFRNGDIVIEPEDIVDFNRRYYHPYVWWLIQQNNFYSLNQLKCS